jgi:hypothetical protein
MCLHNTEKHVCLFLHMYSCWSLKSILCTISKRANFLECPHISSPAWSHPWLPWCSPQPAKKQKKIRVKYFWWQLLVPILSDLYLSTRSSSSGTISCCETLAYFKYTPIKAKMKIITNGHFCDLFWGCHQSQRFLFSYSPFHITTCFGLYRPSSSEIYTVVFKSYYA